MIIIFAVITFISTLIGGLVGLRYKKNLSLFLGFTAGVLLGVVAFDLLPEIHELTAAGHIDAIWPMVALVGGFLLFHSVEKIILVHHGQEQVYKEHTHPTVGIMSALALSAHSFLDGFGIGLGFQISPGTGVLVALAVIAHDFSDGLNTVALMLLNRHEEKMAFRFLLIDAVAPILGVIATLFISFPANWLAMYLGFFAGFLLYIGASEILPQAHSERPSLQALSMTILGALSIFIVMRFL